MKNLNRDKAKIVLLAKSLVDNDISVDKFANKLTQKLDTHLGQLIYYVLKLSSNPGTLIQARIVFMEQEMRDKIYKLKSKLWAENVWFGL